MMICNRKCNRSEAMSGVIQLYLQSVIWYIASIKIDINKEEAVWVMVFKKAVEVMVFKVQLSNP